MTISRLTAALALTALAATLPVRAEVSAETDATGTYIRTVVFANASLKHSKIWSVNRLRTGFTPLNPSGDDTGDLWPFIAENPINGRLPWVVWSHFDGSDFELVWSRWTDAGWSAISPVASPGDPEDALAPMVSFDPTGRPHLVWLSAGDGPKSVFLSIFLTTRWMIPFRVSDPGEDATDPVVAVLSDGTIEVGYATPIGEITKMIRFDHPRTITDDITPFSSLTVTSTSTAPSMTH